jgi:hypothetical protein
MRHAMTSLRRRLRRPTPALHSAATALDDTVSAPGTHDEEFVATATDPTAHAPGHRHLAPPERRSTPRLAHRAWRRWVRRADRTGHAPRR